MTEQIGELNPPNRLMLTPGAFVDGSASVSRAGDAVGGARRSVVSRVHGRRAGDVAADLSDGEPD